MTDAGNNVSTPLTHKRGRRAREHPHAKITPLAAYLGVLIFFLELDRRDHVRQGMHSLDITGCGALKNAFEYSPRASGCWESSMLLRRYVFLSRGGQSAF